MVIKDRPNSTVFFNGTWTLDKLRNIPRVPGSAHWMIIYYTTSTATGRAQTEWQPAGDMSPADWVVAQGWHHLERICAVVYQKPDFQRRKKSGK